jgi:sterol desaturase/sphingolipid hydroxylase (fatty acid hydroxylase superfamily)
MDPQSNSNVQAEKRGIMSHLFALENSKTAYVADLVLYGVAVVGFTIFLFTTGSKDQAPELVVLTLAGLASWTLIEYVLHRFVLHGIKPFCLWHAEHHQRPKALIYTPTIVTALLNALLVFLPAFLILGNLREACAFTLGIIAGFLAFGITHHAVHHWRLGNAWLKRLKHWHALHHHTKQGSYYGVTSIFWDHVFGSTGKPGR